MPPSNAPGKAASLKNKFGFRPPRTKPNTQKLEGTSPKRPRDDVGVASSSQTRAKRAKTTDNTSRPPVIEISDDEDSVTDLGGGDDQGIEEPRVLSSLQAPSISANSANARIVDLTIDSPASESSPEPPEIPKSYDQGRIGPPAMQEAEDTTLDTDVEYQFAFHKSRGDSFATVIKTEVEVQTPMSQRFRSMTLEDDRLANTTHDQAISAPRHRTAISVQALQLAKDVPSSDHRAVRDGPSQLTEGTRRPFLQRLGRMDMPDTAVRKGDVIFMDIPAKSGRDAVALLPAIPCAQTSPATPLSPRLAPNTQNKQPPVSPMTKLALGFRQRPGHQDLGAMDSTFPPAPARSRRLPSRIPVPARALTTSTTLKDRIRMARAAAAPLKTNALATPSSVLPLSLSMPARKRSLDARKGTANSDRRGISQHQQSTQAKPTLYTGLEASWEREETPMERLMPRNTLTPIRTTHFVDLEHRVAENKRLGVQPKRKIFLQQIRAPKVREERLELFWKTIMKLAETDQIFAANHDRLGKCIRIINEQLDKKEHFSWDEGVAVVTELQNQRKMSMTSAANPRLFFTRDGQEVMGVRLPQ